MWPVAGEKSSRVVEELPTLNLQIPFPNFMAKV